MERECAKIKNQKRELIIKTHKMQINIDQKFQEIEQRQLQIIEIKKNKKENNDILVNKNAKEKLKQFYEDLKDKMSKCS